MSRRRHRLTALVAVAVAGVTLAAPATADSRSHRDPTDDVSTARLRGMHAALDITRSASSYAYGRLTLSTSVVSVADTGRRVVWEVRGGGARYLGHVSAHDGEVRARFDEADGSSCGGAVGAVDNDTATLVVPVACLADASSVRVGSYTIRRRAHHRVLVDDAHQGRLRHRPWPALTRPIAYSP